LVNTHILIKDSVEADVTKAGNLTHHAEVAPVIVAQRQDRPATAEHLLPKMRKRPRFSLRVYGGEEVSRGGGLLAAKRTRQQAERQDYSNDAISSHHGYVH
jgi:hypothetical protein